MLDKQLCATEELRTLLKSRNTYDRTERLIRNTTERNWTQLYSVSLWLGSGSAMGRRIGKMVAHDDIIKWKHFPRYWPFVRGIHRSPVNSPHKGQWRGALMFSLICDWINGWVNNREAGDLRRHCAHYDIIGMEVTAPNWHQWVSIRNPLTRFSAGKNCWQ